MEFKRLIIPNVSYFPVGKPDICLSYFLLDFSTAWEKKGKNNSKRTKSWSHLTAVAELQNRSQRMFKYFTSHCPGIDYSSKGVCKRRWKIKRQCEQDVTQRSVSDGCSTGFQRQVSDHVRVCQERIVALFCGPGTNNTCH